MPRHFIVYDTETTGLKKAEGDITLPSGLRSRGDEVCQIGGIVLDERMEPQRLFCHYCDTVKIDCDRAAQQVNGIYMDEVRKYVRCQYLPNVLHDRVPEFFWSDTIFVGYNIDFDQTMVQQTLANTGIPFEWSPLIGSIVPKHGRWAIDVSEYFKQTGNVARGKGSYYRRLSTFDKELEPSRQEFYTRYGAMEVETNCMELFAPSWQQAHNSFYDALNTFLLWRDRVWRKKLV